ncbi:Pentatricopeptide repeat-containing protein [Glycine soja]|uniref:Pentatricopeptide repeat-containing protein n=1 Tax=Glycine soja TaxID=3848 RepID=A0A445KED7_GLYSO|nr:Pentatricopeptide repeat-containing protein [Glycine soja]
MEHRSGVNVEEHTPKLLSFPKLPKTPPATFSSGLAAALPSVRSSSSPACLSPDDLLEHGMPIHAHIVVAGFELDTFVQSSLITMYAQCGDLNTSNYIFDVLANKNSSTWNAILPANAHYGPGEEALKLIIKMKNDGVHLDQFSFSVALAIVGNLTLLDEGQQLHSLIIKHGFESNDYVLNTTMDMYGKCGEIDDGFRILPQPRSRSQRSWNILISALARHGFFQQARETFPEMLDLGWKPENVRKQMESHSIKKKPIKLKNQVTIGIGDQYLPQNAEIYAKLEELKKMISEASYVHTSYSLQDTDEEQKEHILWNHSERIAHAFGLINSSKCSP